MDSVQTNSVDTPQYAKVAISLGSNVAPKLPTLKKAIAEIAVRDIGQVILASPFYKTSPWGVQGQDWYVNACIIIQTALSPRELLKALQKIENDYGRVRGEKWGPRTLDLDILMFEGKDMINEPDLVIPHPYMLQREFVLRPLNDMIPWLSMGDKTIQECLNALPQKDDLFRVPDHPDPFVNIMDLYWKLNPRDIKPGLERIMATMNSLLGDYEKALPPVIHIAGTNGKGSTAAILHKLLNKAGRTVHRYTSPHLRGYKERFIVGVSAEHNRFAHGDEFEIAVSRVAPYIEHHKLSHFEALTCTALLIFSNAPADYIILETGMGGRLDATNIFSNPVMTAITSVSMDHKEFLGDIIESIAYEKAGIIKPNVPVVIGARSKAARRVILEHCEAVGGRPSLLGKDWDVSIVEETECYISEKINYEVFLDTLSLKGVHQLDNAGVALDMFFQLEGDILDDDQMDSALESIYWPARLERLNPERSAVKFLPEFEIIIDGCHNADSAISFVEHMLALNVEDVKDMKIAVSFKQGRDLYEMFNILGRLDAEFIFIKHNKATDQYSAALLERIAHEYDIRYRIVDTMYHFLEEIAMDDQYFERRYAVCGSIYFCGAFFNQIDYKVTP